MGIFNSPCPSYLIASSYGAIAGSHLGEAPELSRPLQTLEISVAGRVVSPAISDRFIMSEQEQLALNGVSCTRVDKQGGLLISREITTYQVNLYGSPDISYLDVQTLAQLRYMMRYFTARLTQRYPRSALASDANGGNTFLATPRDIGNTIIEAYIELVNIGVCEKSQVFADSLKVERSDSDPSRVDLVIRPDVVNQLRSIAILNQFLLEV